MSAPWQPQKLELRNQRLQQACLAYRMDAVCFAPDRQHRHFQLAEARPMAEPFTQVPRRRDPGRRLRFA
jgi:hypothetical protein